MKAYVYDKLRTSQKIYMNVEGNAIPNGRNALLPRSVKAPFTENIKIR